MIDGEAIWTSQKLARVEPPWYRAEYTNLLPLALANGSFECDPRLVWTKVYSFNRKDISDHDVAKILDEYERVKLLFRWTATDGKQWGYWVGINKPGRLPSSSKQLNYERGLDVPDDRLSQWLVNVSTTSAQCEDNVPQGLDRIGLDRIGIGKEGYAERKVGKTNFDPLTGQLEDSLAVVQTLPLNDKTEFPITQTDVEYWHGLYPAVDVRQSFNKMRGWCEANPTHLKTKRGIRTFINTWLAKDQDKARKHNGESKIDYRPQSSD